MDWLDFLVKFSGEALVVAMALLVALMNLYFFAGEAPKTYADNSLAAKFLSYHPNSNHKLYAKNSSIVTTVAKPGGFIAQAQADELVSLSNESASPQPPQNADMVLDGAQDILAKPNPDSVQQLIAKQIKIYQTLPGDNVNSLAARNGLSPQTIIWANNLGNGNLKPGWFLLILPTDGILVKAGDNDTLPDIAAKYNPEKYNPNKSVRDASTNKLLESIISYNALDGAEDIQGGDLIIVPGGVIPQPPKPKAVPKPKTDKSKVGGSGPVDKVAPPEFDEGNGHLFPKGYCTWYVAQKLGSKVKWGGNAKNWIANSKAYGAVTDRDPAVGTILVTNDSRRYGHVAYVEQVTDHSVIVSEMNYSHFGKVDIREIPLGSKIIKGFIHP